MINLIVICFSFSLLARDLTYAENRDALPRFLSIRQTEKTIHVTKKANLFSDAMAIGEFSGELSSKEFEELEAIHLKLLKADEELRKVGKSFNQLSTINGHEPIISFDRFLITPQSVLFLRILRVIKKICAKDLKLQSGIRLKSDRSFLLMNNGKVVEERRLRPTNDCFNENVQSYCLTRDFGVIFMK